MSKHIFFVVCYYILLLVHFGLKAGCKNAEKAVLLPKWYTWHICIFFHVHDTGIAAVAKGCKDTICTYYCLSYLAQNFKC